MSYNVQSVTGATEAPHLNVFLVSEIKVERDRNPPYDQPQIPVRSESTYVSLF